ncbi:unnamed protein product [Didymodactylos carnosus]|uniref:WD repeat-containing protein on Y chromosome n=1 Tax=Didymodactylos carnosus TaxID=1234261 RepID=A0A8S2DC35_9BILA|nr:unnamed protein product [Didymodactylos carnosus]CAF3700954.1 unnamed protein product [Didymodactylos carnosus]
MLQILVQAVEQYLKYIRHENIMRSSSRKSRKLIQSQDATNLEQTVEDMVTFEFVEKVRKSFAEADIGQRLYLLAHLAHLIASSVPDKVPDSYLSKKQLEILQLGNMLLTIIGIHLVLVALMKRCKKINSLDTNCDGTVDLSEYLTYILFEHQEREIMYDMMKPIPYPHTSQEFTARSLALDLYIGFQFFPGLLRSGKPLDEIDYNYGRYISVTRSGIVSHWSASLKLIRESKIQPTEQRKRALPLWITCMCIMPNMNYFAVATTERDLILYDMNSHTYTGSIMVNSFSASLTAIDYRMNIKDAQQSALFCGDSLGNLFVIYPKDKTRPMFHISDHTRGGKTGITRIFNFPRISANEYSTVSVLLFCNLHDDWVAQVKWIPQLNLFASCSLTTKRSLYLGDLEKKTVRYAEARKGFYCFDYCQRHRAVVTGGSDGVVRFWDPFVTEKSGAILRGHNASVTHLAVDNKEDHVISIDKGKNIIIWDVFTLKMIQRISHTVLELGEQDLTVCYLNPLHQRLIIGNKKLISFAHINESYMHTEKTSHLNPVTHILYNPLFDVGISCDEGSTINIWNMQTGEKVMHILNAHQSELSEYNERSTEITAMCLDEAKRRLLTGAHDGSLALWNFNNGHNLYRVSAKGNDEREITSILHSNERLCVAGWSRKVKIYHLGNSSIIRQVQHEKPCQDVNEFRSLHNDDILSMCLMSNILATASYDGDIILWTVETGMPFMRFNASQDIKPKLVSLSWLYKQTTKGAIRATFPNYFSRRRIQKKKRNIENTERKTNVYVEHNKSTISSDYHLDQLIFLHTRETSPYSASLVAAGSMGWVWFWSVHVIGQLIAVFNGARKSQADTAGYIALWYIGDYAIKHPDTKEKQNLLMESKRQIFQKFHTQMMSPIPGIQEMRDRAERVLQEKLGSPPINTSTDRVSYLSDIMMYPQLLSAFRAHLKPITSIFFADDREIIITGSVDCTVRLFTITGRYIGFMGQSVPWGPLSQTIVLKDLPKIIPEDIRRKGSATTLELLRGDIGKRWKLLKHTIVAWTSLPVFRFFYQQQPRSQIAVVPEQSTQDDVQGSIQTADDILKKHDELSHQHSAFNKPSSKTMLDANVSRKTITK